MKADQILPTLLTFKESSSNRILIDGHWGIGKTKYVNDFMKVHTNCCYVSLFGKRNIESILQEIYFNIIDKAQTGKVKKLYTQLSGKLKQINISLVGIGLSIPLIENIYKAVDKELIKKDSYIIIFDDLERKHDDLDIKEVLGLVDSLSNIENIKTVLITSSKQLSEIDNKKFTDYKEKAIDRIYKIDKFADEAPQNILGKENWGIVSRYVMEHEFTNLRTFEKASVFINEVIKVLGKDIFTERFPKEDLIKICFSTVFFCVEHKGEMVLLENDNELLHSIYSNDESGIAEYLNTYILKYSLSNQMSKSVYPYIITWYRNGAFSKQKLLNVIDAMNNSKEKVRNFFSSEAEIKDLINSTKVRFEKLDGTEKLADVINDLNIAITWSELLSIEFGFTNEEILTILNNHIENHINVIDSIHENEITSWHFHTESKRGVELIKAIDKKTTVAYSQRLLKTIKACFSRRSCKEIIYIDNLLHLIYKVKDNSDIKSIIIEEIQKNSYFFIMPSGSINEELWLGLFGSK